MMPRLYIFSACIIIIILAVPSSLVSGDEFEAVNATSEPVSSSTEKPLGYHSRDIMSDKVRAHGGFILHIFVLVYASLSLALLCDSYFVPALQTISKALEIPGDISGATFMAIGTSAPELFTSLIALFQGESDMGTGTILGSAIFNLVGVPAVCGISICLWGSLPSKVQPFPVIRDSIFYSITVLALYLALKDNSIDLSESIVLIFLYAIYIFIMYVNSRINTYIVDISANGNEDKGLLSKSVKVENILGVRGKNGYETQISYTSDVESKKSIEIQPSYGSFTDDSNDEEEEVDWIIEIKFLKYFLYPANYVFSHTIPDHSKWIVSAFVASSVYIGLLTYVAVWAVNLLSLTMAIPEAIAGVTIMAAASSVPELISNVIIIKKTGKANTALSNAIGSNVFDILICLGVPWFIKIIINKINNVTPSAVSLASKALPATTLTILSAILALVVTLRVTNWKLGLKVGLICSVVYIILVVFFCTLGISM